MMAEKKETVFRDNVKNQYFAALAVNLTCLGFTIQIGWSSPAIIVLTSNESSLPSGPISKDEFSWITSLLMIACAISNLVYPYISKHFGRKTLLLFNAIPITLSWVLISLAQNVFYLYVARFMAGFFGASSVITATLFLSENASDRVRGILTASLLVSQNFGLLLAYAIGAFSLNAIAIFSTFLMIISIILIYFIPESSLFLLKRGRLAETERSVRFFRNLRESNDDDDKILNLEIDKLRLILADARRHSSVTSDTSLKWTDFTTKVARKALAIGIVLAVIAIVNGSSGFYTAAIFEETGSVFSSNVSAIITATLSICACSIAMYAVDRAGRKPLIAVSGIGTAFGLIVLSIYMMLKARNFPLGTMNWIPLAAYSFVNFTASLGVQTLPMLVVTEIMPESIRDVGVSICVILISTLQILSSKYLLILFEAFGFHWVMFGSATICLGGTIFILIFLPETKNKSYGDIMKALEN